MMHKLHKHRLVEECYQGVCIIYARWMLSGSIRWHAFTEWMGNSYDCHVYVCSLSLLVPVF